VRGLADSSIGLAAAPEHLIFWKENPVKRVGLIVSIVLLSTCSLDVFAQRRAPAQVPGDTRPRPTVHQAGPKLAETELYELYEYFIWNPKAGCFNSPNSNQDAAVSLVFKVDANYVITDSVFKQRFEKEMLPVIRSRCGPVSRVNVFTYIKGVKIDRDFNEHSYDDPSFKGNEMPLAVIWVKIDGQGGITYENLSSAKKGLADVRKERRQNENAEARLNESARAQEAERQREKEARQERLRRESKGGQEPSSEDLALALARLALPSCRNMEYQKLCEASPSFFVEVKEAVKLSCQPVAVGKNYICEYRVQFECYIPSRSGDLVVSPTHCLILPTRTYKTGALRTSGGWTIYPLDKK
jgi:hypothetical protein